MTKKILNLSLVLAAAGLFTLLACKKTETPTPEPPATDTATADTIVPEEPADDIYQFSVLDGQGDSVALSTFRGKVLLVVNSATQCGYTPQYVDIERIYETYRDSGFVVLDFPCNQFGRQAPGSYSDIHNYCTENYNITFPQFAKIDVNGPQASPLYVWLKEKKPGEIQWNFTKFLIDRNGNVTRRFEPNDSMKSVETAVKRLL